MDKYSTLFIDLDDTLFDFAGASREAFRETYELLGYSRFFASFDQIAVSYCSRFQASHSRELVGRQCSVT